MDQTLQKQTRTLFKKPQTSAVGLKIQIKQKYLPELPTPQKNTSEPYRLAVL